MGFGLHCLTCHLQEASHMDPDFEDQACTEYLSPSPKTEEELKAKGDLRSGWPNVDLGNGPFDRP